MYDVAVIGGGPAGLSAAIQVRARGKSVLVVSGDDRDNPLYKSERIDNYLGFYDITGAAMMEQFRAHALRMGVERKEGRVLNIMPMNDTFYLSIGSDMEQARAVVLESCCTAAIEETCDQAEKEMKARLPGAFFTTRYSPGYGDLPIGIQGEFLSLLEAPKRLGLCASDSAILIPRKSVTAIIGVADHPLAATGSRRCEGCSARENCPYRQKEEYCGR